MAIEAYMKHPVHCVKPLDSIQHARALMEEHRVNQLPVVAKGRVVGIVTDRDLRDAFPSVFDNGRAPSPESDPKTIAVETVMSQNVLSLGPKDTVVDAARLMRRERIGAIPIVDRDRLVGILTRSDVLDAFVALAALAADKKTGAL
jgi:acetoin utilization protein AcuB